MDEKRVDKVQKLLQKAERAGTQEEAETYFAKAQELMTRWAIDDAMLAAAGKSEEDIIVTEHITIKRSGYFRALCILARGIALANSARTVRYPAAQWGEYAGVDIIGWKSDVERVKMLYASIQIQMTRERRRATPEYLKGQKDSVVNRWKHSFSESYAAQIGRRLEDQQRRTRKESVDDDDSGKMLPALVNRDEKLASFMEGLGLKKARRSTRRVDMNGWSSGAEAANRADLGNTGVGDTRDSIGR